MDSDENGSSCLLCTWLAFSPASAVTRHGESMLSMTMPCPHCPCRPQPQQKTRPSELQGLHYGDVLVVSAPTTR